MRNFFGVLATLLTEQKGFMSCSRTQNDKCVRLQSGTSRSQVEHSNTEPIGKADMISGVGSYHIGD